MDVGRTVEARSREGGVGDVGSLSLMESFPMSTDWPRSWRGRAEGVIGAETGGCGSGLRDCLAML